MRPPRRARRQGSRERRARDRIYRREERSRVVPPVPLPLPLPPQIPSLFSDSQVFDFNSLIDYSPQQAALAANFDAAVSRVVVHSCVRCPRVSPSLKLDPRTQSCSHCKTDAGVEKFSSRNNMDPGVVPDELRCLTYIEQMLIAQVHPVVSLFRIQGNQFAYRGNVISFPQNIEAYSAILPVRPSDLTSTVFFSKPTSTGVASFRANQIRIRNALVWLKANNQYYRHIVISEDNLSQIPLDGDVSQQLRHLFENDRQDADPGDNVVHESFLVVDTPVNNEALIRQRLHLPYPSTSRSPINEFLDEGFVVRAFPALFPTGNADLNQPRNIKLTAIEYFRFLLEFHDGRFVKDPRFRYFAMNMLNRREAISTVQVYMKRCPNVPRDVEEIRERLQSNPNFLNSLMTFSSKIRGSQAYWYQRSRELLDMVDQIGLPTAFLTLSSADYHWPDLFRLIANQNEDISTLSEQRRRTLMHDNPHTVAFFFQARCDIFIDEVLTPLFKVVDLWHRYEWQWRGSGHLHGLFWFADSPVMDTAPFTAEQIELIRLYFDEKCKAINPNCDSTPAVVHPSRKRFSDVPSSDRLVDLTELINCFQRHTQCGVHCLRKVGDELKCRYKFPFDCRLQSVVEEKDGFLQFLPARNDPLLNKMNCLVSQIWRANTDFSPVVDKKALLNYIAKYASKAEKSSKSYVDVLHELVSKRLDETPASKVFSSFVISNFAERDFSAQEVMHQVMGYKLYRCSRDFISLFVEDEWQHVNVEGERQTVRLGRSFVQKYRTRTLLRPDLESVSLFDFAKKHNFDSRGRISNRRKEPIVRVFPRLKLNDDPENDEKFYRLQVILNVPFQGEEFRYDDLLLDPNSSVPFDSWKSRFESLNLSAAEATDFPELNPDEEGEIAFPDRDNDYRHIEPFAAAANLGPVRDASQLLGRRELDLAREWTAASQSFPDIEEVRRFLRTFEQNAPSRSFDFDDNITLSSEQQEVMDIFQQQVNCLLTNQGDPPRRIVVQGKAGCGKSTLIHKIVQEARRQFGDTSVCILGAFTGSAAVNIGGRTLHSLFHLDISRNKPLADDSLRKFQKEMENVRFVIIDEMSMVGAELFRFIEMRCREATCVQALFGGLMVYLFGDFRQLPPVAVVSLYSSGVSSPLELQGQLLFDGFDRFIELSVCQRQRGDDSEEFRTLLDNIANGTPTDRDYELLMSRREALIVCRCGVDGCLRCIETKSFDDALKLFPTNAKVDEANNAYLASTGNPVARILSENTPSTGSKEKGKTLQHVLNLAIGCRVMLRKNICVRLGLVNSSIGILRAIVYAPGSVPPALPLYVLVQFLDYKGPCLIDDLFPIVPITESWMKSGTNFTRKQLPISLAHAVTGHKSQGLTLPKVVVDIGEREMSAGITYVELSRVRKLTDLMILGYFTKQRLNDIAKMKDHQDKLAFINKYWPQR
jgi:ATP-dependent DNA helicase PIF1